MGIVHQLAEDLEHAYESIPRDVEALQDKLFEAGPRFTDLGEDPHFLIGLHSFWIQEELKRVLAPYKEQVQFNSKPQGEGGFEMIARSLPQKRVNGEKGGEDTFQLDDRFWVERDLELNDRSTWKLAGRELSELDLKRTALANVVQIGTNQLLDRNLLAVGSGDKLFYMSDNALPTLSRSFLPAHLLER